MTHIYIFLNISFYCKIQYSSFVKMGKLCNQSPKVKVECCPLFCCMNRTEVNILSNICAYMYACTISNLMKEKFKAQVLNFLCLFYAALILFYPVVQLDEKLLYSKQNSMQNIVCYRCRFICHIGRQQMPHKLGLLTLIC